jgi:hypothetical protein
VDVEEHSGDTFDISGGRDRGWGDHFTCTGYQPDSG